MNAALLIIIAFLIVAFIVAVFIVVFKARANFFLTGFDSGFKRSEISLLWSLSKKTNMEDPSALFWSVAALDRNISFLLEENQKNGGINTKETQDFLEKLYKYRTKIYLDPLKHKGLQDTRSLVAGQKIVVLLKAKSGVHLSKVVKVGKNIEITLPIYKKTEEPLFHPETWVKQAVSVYFMRKDDAAYVFDTVVLGTGISGDGPTLFLAHSNNLVRTQKRKSVRASCKIPAQMYIARHGPEDLKGVSAYPGLKCLIEDISEDGALIRIGGRGVKNLMLKLQFMLGNSFIVMGGTVRGVEHDPEKNQSLLHLETLFIDKNMKNEILGFVYNVLPPEQKDAAEAVSTIQDETSETTVSQENESSQDNSEQENNELSSESSENNEQTQDEEKKVAENQISSDNDN